MIRVLHVEDNPADARLVRELLSEDTELGFRLTTVDLVSRAIETLSRDECDIVLLDLGLPDAIGLEAIDTILDAYPGLPVVVMSGQNDQSLAVEAVQHGAQDYLIKGHGDSDLLCRSIRYAIERKRSEQYIKHMAHHDGLTNLPNRRLLMDRLDQGLARSRRNRRLLGIIFTDLDNFKTINDTLGHSVGDDLLLAVATRLSHCVRESDTVARWGGDEFCIVLPEIHSADDLSILAEKILDALRKPFHLDGREVRVSASLGLSSYPADGVEPELLLRSADSAMYRAKHLGRNGYQYFSRVLPPKSQNQPPLDAALRRAIKNNELELHYQPMIDLSAGTMAGFEVLLRWNHPEWGQMQPRDFIPAAEENGLIVPIGEWVLDGACRQMKAWNQAGLGVGRVAVNLSCRQFSDQGLPQMLRRVIRDTRIDPSLLELELTESTLMENVETGAAAVAELKSMGFNISIDDFGTGYSSLARLRDFRIDALKIDRSFIHDVDTTGRNTVIVEAIIALGHALNLRVIAEGVERDEQVSFLLRHDCDQSQGFFFSRPLPVGEAESLLETPPPGWGRSLNHLGTRVG